MDAVVDVESEDHDQTLHLPYYLENFTWIVSSVQGEAQYQEYFEENNCFWRQTIASFAALQLDAQKLYVRLFLRKHVYLTREKIRYEDEFGGNEKVDDLLSVLCSAGFLETDASHLDLKDQLKLLNAVQVKDLAKKFRIGKAGQGKNDLVPLILKTARQQRTPFGPPLHEVVTKYTAKLLRNVYRLHKTHRDIFLHLLSLFQLTAGLSSPVGQNPIFALLQINMGKLTFPNFKVDFTRPFFRSTSELALFNSARQCLDEIYECWKSKDFLRGKSIYHKILPAWENLVNDVELTDHIAALPLYVRKFSYGYYWTKVIEKGLEILERLDERSDAINGYLHLLQQKVYVPHHRGHWYNRATILMLKIDKNPDAVVKMLLKGVKDKDLRPHQKLELLERLKRVYKPEKLRKQHKFRMQDLNMPYKEGMRVEICGKLCPTEGMGKGKTSFIGEDGHTVVCSVEELALTHYRKNGYPQGVHSEGSIISSVYGLLFWDVIYSDGIPDVFRSKFQIAPLDFFCPSFFCTRKKIIEQRLQFLSDSDMETIVQSASETWNSQFGIYSAAVNWDLFVSLESFLGVLVCFRPQQLARICERFAQNYGAVRAGFPDLTVWNPETKQLKFAEVKGPNDRLSFKQMLWIDFLINIDVPVEVCHVIAVGSKKRKFSVMNL